MTKDELKILMFDAFYAYGHTGISVTQAGAIVEKAIEIAEERGLITDTEKLREDEKPNSEVIYDKALWDNVMWDKNDPYGAVKTESNNYGAGIICDAYSEGARCTLEKGHEPDIHFYQ